MSHDRSLGMRQRRSGGARAGAPAATGVVIDSGGSSSGGGGGGGGLGGCGGGWDKARCESGMQICTARASHPPFLQVRKTGGSDLTAAFGATVAREGRWTWEVRVDGNAERRDLQDVYGMGNSSQGRDPYHVNEYSDSYGRAANLMLGVCGPDVPLNWMTRVWGGGSHNGASAAGSPWFVKSAGDTTDKLGECHDFGAVGDVVRIAVDFDEGTVTFGKLVPGGSGGAAVAAPLPNMVPADARRGANVGPLRGPLSLWVNFDNPGDTVTILREEHEESSLAVPVAEAAAEEAGGAGKEEAGGGAGGAAAAPPAAPATAQAAAGGGGDSSSSSSSDEDEDGSAGDGESQAPEAEAAAAAGAAAAVQQQLGKMSVYEAV